MTDLIKQAEQNVIKLARAWEDALTFVDTLSNFGNKYCHEHIGKNDFFVGLQQVRKAMYSEYVDAIHNCFVFAGIGGEDAAEYSREMFRAAFSEKDRYQILQFLDEHGHRPPRWTSDEDDEFRRQAQEVLKKQTLTTKMEKK